MTRFHASAALVGVLLIGSALFLLSACSPSSDEGLT